MVGIRLFSLWEQNIDSLVANHHTDEKKEHAKKPKERLRGALWFGDHQTSLVPVFCPSLAPK